MEAGTRPDRTERAKNSANASSYRVHLRDRGANGGWHVPDPVAPDELVQLGVDTHILRA